MRFDRFLPRLPHVSLPAFDFGRGFGARGFGDGIPLVYKIAVVGVMMLVAGGTLITFGSADARPSSTTVAAAQIPSGTEASPQVESQPIVAPLTTDPLGTTPPLLSSTDLLSTLDLGDTATSTDETDDTSSTETKKSDGKRRESTRKERRNAKRTTIAVKQPAAQPQPQPKQTQAPKPAPSPSSPPPPSPSPSPAPSQPPATTCAPLAHTLGRC